jgi:hypothetical protein
MADQYDWWRGACSAVAERALEAYFGAHPIHDGEPMSGFYETRSKNKQTGQESRGVAAIWRDQSDTLHGRLGKDFVLTEQKIMERWQFLAKRPIFHPTYKFVLENGGRFPDESAIAHSSRKAPPPDTLEGIKERVGILADEGERLITEGAAKTTETAAHAEDIADTLRDLGNSADALRKAEKKPHWDAGQAVDQKWKPTIDQAETVKGRLFKLVVTPFKVKERSRLETEAKLEAEEVGNESGVAVEATPAATVKGLYPVKSAEIVDSKLAMLHFASHPKMIELVQALANARVRADENDVPPGCKLKITMEAR